MGKGILEISSVKCIKDENSKVLVKMDIIKETVVISIIVKSNP